MLLADAYHLEAGRGLRPHAETLPTNQRRKVQEKRIAPPFHHQFRLGCHDFHLDPGRFPKEDQRMADQGRQGLFRVKGPFLVARAASGLYRLQGRAQLAVLLALIPIC